MADIFISYSRRNAGLVETIAERLRIFGATVWMDTAALTASETWSAEIVAAISACEVFIILLSPDSVSSENVTKELSLASEKKKMIVPIELAACTLNPAMEYALAGVLRVSVADWRGMERTLDKLGLAVGGVMEIPAEEQSLLRLAVVPFEDQSPTHDNEWFSDGLTDELISTLGNLNHIFVIDKQTAREYKNTTKRSRDIALELGVRYLVRGAVRKAGEQIRIQADLVDTQTGKTLWTRNFPGRWTISSKFRKALQKISHAV